MGRVSYRITVARPAHGAAIGAKSGTTALRCTKFAVQLFDFYRLVKRKGCFLEIIGTKL